LIHKIKWYVEQMSSAVESAYNDFGHNNSSPIATLFVSPGRIPIFYVHLSSATTTLAVWSLRL